MSDNKWNQLFPTPWSLMIFLSYMALFINQGLLVTASQTNENGYSYNTVTVVLLSEITKLMASLLLYAKEKGFVSLIEETRKHSKVLLLYMVPAFLYCLYNNLAFVNLSAYDPTTYFLLLQLRVVVTGIIFQVLFNKRLSRSQWISLLILTCGCLVKQLNTTNKSEEIQKSWDFNNIFSVHTGLILVQVFCSCIAGVYNEKLLKDTGAEVHIMAQNVYMYTDSIMCNLVILFGQGSLVSTFTEESLLQVFKPVVLAIIVNNAAVGIITSLFLQKLNSILKTFASALELMFTAVLSWLIFGMAIGEWTIVAIVLVTSASWMYAQNPVVNTGRLLPDAEETSKLPV